MRKRKRKNEEQRVAEFLEQHGFADEAQRMAMVWSDAGRYLSERAEASGRTRGFISNAGAMEQALLERGVWQETYEWRISTDGTDKIEALPDGFRVSVDHHGDWTVVFESFAEALEALHVLSAIQKDLFWIAGWSSWAGRGRMKPGDPAREHEEAEEPGNRERYLTQLSIQARGANELAESSIRHALDNGAPWSDHFAFEERVYERSLATHEWEDWDGTRKTLLAFTVANDSMKMEAKSPTIERAAEFMGIFVRLQPPSPEYWSGAGSEFVAQSHKPSKPDPGPLSCWRLF